EDRPCRPRPARSTSGRRTPRAGARHPSRTARRRSGSRPCPTGRRRAGRQGPQDAEQYGSPEESRLGRMTDDETAPLGREPLVIAAFEGWNDAGSAATSALHHLHEVWGAEIVDALDPEEFHDFQVNRPVVGFDPETGQRRISWPTTHFATLRTPVLDRHV